MNSQRLPSVLVPRLKLLVEREKRRSSRAAAVSKMYNSLTVSSFMWRRSRKKTKKSELLDQKRICRISSSCSPLNEVKAANMYNTSPLSPRYISNLFEVFLRKSYLINAV